MTTGKRLLTKVAPYAHVIQGLAHPHRLAIMYLLAHDPTWVKDLVNNVGIPENLVAHHLNILLRAGWVTKKREGRHVIYTLSRKPVLEVTKLFVDTPLGREKLS